MTQRDNLSPETLLAQLDHFRNDETGAVVPAVETSTTFARNADYEMPGAYRYSREGNPNFTVVEGVVARLEGGAAARLFGSGLAAATAIFETLKPGAHVVAPRIMYHGLQEWLHRLESQGRLSLTLVDGTAAADFAAAVRPGETEMLWIEPITNPSWDVTDIAAMAAVAHGAGAILGVDSTCTPPVTTKPLSLGADLVFHSATKFLNGHSDVLGGIVITKAENARWNDLCMVRTRVGGIMGPFEAWLLARGMRTLSLRFARHSENALSVARHFHGHPKIKAVLYPGLESHPGHDIAKKQMTGGFGGMMSLRINGDAAAARGVAARCKLFVPATSLGGVESLIEHRKTVEGDASAVPDDLVRLSVGIEDVQDLIADLEQALDAV